MRVFFDSSAFVKRYVSEVGTEAVLGGCDRASEISLSGIASCCRPRHAPTPLLWKPRQCLFYRWPARRSPVYAILQLPPLKIVYPCGSPGNA